MQGEGMIRIRRPDGDGGGEFSVTVDGRAVGTLGAGDELVVYVPPGSHVVAARFAWISSPPYEVTVGDDQRVSLTARRAFGFGPFDLRYFTQRRRAIAIEPTG